MKHIMIVLCTTALLLVAGCVAATAEEPPTAKYEAFTTVNDVNEPVGAVRVMQEIEAKQIAEEEITVDEADEDEWYDEGYYEESYAPIYSGDGFQQQGVRDGVDSDTETWYSSNRAYHEDTAQWSVDDEGYYRTDEGYYVIASNDYEKGTVINTSKGEAQVLDDGTDSGNADFYVAW